MVSVSHYPNKSNNKTQNLTCVAGSFALDFPRHTCALFHIAEVNSSPRLSCVIIAQVYGFIALFCKKKSRHIKGDGVEMWEAIDELNGACRAQFNGSAMQHAFKSGSIFLVLLLLFRTALNAKWNLFLTLVTQHSWNWRRNSCEGEEVEREISNNS